MDPATLLALALLLVLIGAATGVVAGLLGVGGGIVLVPAFYYTFGQLGFHSDKLMQVAIGTSAATIVVTSVRSVIAHHRKGAVDMAILKRWGPFLVAGSVLGVLAASKLRSTELEAIFGVLAGIAGLYMAFGRAEWRLGQEMPRQPVSGAMGVALAFCSALMGIGGGTFGVPMMTLYNQPIHRAVATSAGFGILISVPAILGFVFFDIPGAPPYSLGAVNLPAFAIIISMTLLTTPLGVRLAHAMNPAPLKRAFAIFLVIVALNMLRKAIGW